MRLVYLTMLMGCTLMVSAQNDLIPRDSFFTPIDRTQVQLSPGGDAVAYIAGGRVYVVALPQGAPKMVSDSFVVQSYRWAYGDRILLTSRSVKGSGMMIYIADPQTGEHNHLSPYVLNGVKLVKLSPNHPDKAIFALSFTDRNLDGLYELRLDKRDWKHVGNTTGFSNWFFDDDLHLRASVKPDKLYHNRIYFQNTLGEWTEIRQPLKEKGRPISGMVSVSADGMHIYYVNNYKKNTAVLKKRSLITGKEKVIARDKRFDLLWAGAHIGADGIPAAVVGYFGDLERLFLNNSLEAEYAFLSEKMEGHISFGGQSKDGSKWLVRSMNGGPFKYAVYDRTNRLISPLFSDNSALDPYILASRHTFKVKSFDGSILPTHLYLPPGSDTDKDGLPDSPLPTVLYVHGGPWVGFLANSTFANRNFQLLANRGYAVINCEFRGSTGYGKKFLDAGNRQWGGKMHRDIEEIARAAIKEGIAKQGKLGIWGWSYGGYETATALALSPDLFSCGVAMYGVYDLPRFIRDNAPTPWWYERTGHPGTEKGIARLRSVSPVYLADGIRAPMLITHGAKDEVTPQSQSDSLVARLLALDKTVIYTVYKDEPHDYRQPKSWASFWATAEKFLSMHLGGKAEPVGEAFTEPSFRFLTGQELLFPSQ